MTRFEVFILVACITLLTLLTCVQHRKAERVKEEAQAVEYTKALEYQHREQAREQENRRIIRIFKDRYFDQIADAIYWSEGGPNTRFPYGIKSVLVKDAAEARLVCLRTIENSWDRYEKTDCTDFIAFLGATYCPESVDPVGHVNWVKNVKFFVDNPKPLP